MAVVNAQTGAIVTTLPIGEGVDATAFDSGSQLAFSSNGDGTLTDVHEDSRDTFTLVQNVATPRYACTMAIDPNTHDAYLVTAKFRLGPPAAGEGRPTRTLVPGRFTLLVVAPASQRGRAGTPLTRSGAPVALSGSAWRSGTMQR